jgi:SAM-dependent methyltransferase
VALDGEMYGEAYYTTTYRDYARQNPPHKLAFYRSIVEGHMPSRRPARVLDIGCGLGSFIACLRDSDLDRKQFILAGMDVSEFAVAVNKAKYPEETFTVCSADEIASLGQTFDAVTAFDVLEHLQHPDRAADAIASSLADDGTFIFVVPVYDGPLGPLVKLLDKDESHVQLRSRHWWLDWTNSHFDVTGWLGIFRILTPWSQYIHMPTTALRRVAPAILITAGKRTTADGAKAP